MFSNAICIVNNVKGSRFGFSFFYLLGFFKKNFLSYILRISKVNIHKKFSKGGMIMSWIVNNQHNTMESKLIVI